MKYQKKILVLTTLNLFFSCGSAQDNESKKKNLYKFEKSDMEWKTSLSKMSYMVLRKSATEYPFTGKYNIHSEAGTYHCAGCNTPLYESVNKYESSCGWPSFDKAIESNIEYDVDYKLGYARMELKCNKCGGHLGHIFNDGPKETTGKRHCVNSAALNFVLHKNEK